MRLNCESSVSLPYNNSGSLPHHSTDPTCAHVTISTKPSNDNDASTSVHSLQVGCTRTRGITHALALSSLR
jgi:hypothetical protein